MDDDNYRICSIVVSINEYYIFGMNVNILWENFNISSHRLTKLLFFAQSQDFISLKKLNSDHKGNKIKGKDKNNI